MEGDFKHIKTQAAEKLVVIEKSHMQIYESALATRFWQKTASMDEALALGFLEGGLDAANFLLVTNGLRQAADVTMPLDYAVPMLTLFEAMGFSYILRGSHDGVNMT